MRFDRVDAPSPATFDVHGRLNGRLLRGTLLARAQPGCGWSCNSQSSSKFLWASSPNVTASLPYAVPPRFSGKSKTIRWSSRLSLPVW